MTTYHVRYLVPVVAVVDTDLDEVTRVVCDEEIGLPVDVSDDDKGILLDDDTAAARARAVAERCWWPGWEFGW